MNRLGSSGVEGSPLAFGGAVIGNLYTEVSDEQAHEAVTAAWQQGIRYFDTAPHYGLGLSERRLGAALRERPRAQYTISTKVGRRLEPWDGPVTTWPTASPYRPRTAASGTSAPTVYGAPWRPPWNGSASTASTSSTSTTPTTTPSRPSTRATRRWRSCARKASWAPSGRA